MEKKSNNKQLKSQNTGQPTSPLRSLEYFKEVSKKETLGICLAQTQHYPCQTQRAVRVPPADCCCEAQCPESLSQKEDNKVASKFYRIKHKEELSKLSVEGFLLQLLFIYLHKTAMNSEYIYFENAVFYNASMFLGFF